MMKILNFGSCNIDYVYSLDHIVNAGETETTYSMETFPGGKGLNQSIALAKAGANVYHAGCIGTDGSILTEILSNSNVDTSFIKYVDEKNGHAIIQVSKDGENSIFLYPGSNEMISKEHIDFVLGHFSEGDIILLQNEINNLEYIITKANKIGMTIILNPSPYNEKLAEIDLNMISCLILNEVEAKAITGQNEPEAALRYFKEEYPDIKVMLTLGKNGCIYFDKNNKIYHPIFKVEAVDTTAAGDTFTGYFVAGISKGDDYKEILRTASCASAISVSKNGAAPSIPDIDEVLSKINLLEVQNCDIRSDSILRTIERYIDSNVENATLEELAMILGYSTVYTGNIVSKITGKTFKKLLQDKRIAVAVRLLSETDMTIYDIIKVVGYENESYFRKIFKEKYGENPLTYRKTIRMEK